MRKFLSIFFLVASGATLGQDTAVPVEYHYKYIVGSASVPDDWRSADFDDSGWKGGNYTIGFGDGDDSTVVEQCTSVFVRYPFVLNEFQLDSVREIVFYADYDDGFVAYFNGKEVLRKFMGKDGSPVEFDQLADKSHEAMSSKSHNNQFGYYIDTAVLRLSLRAGLNILAVEVHNDSIAGSDLSFSCQLMNRTFSEFYPYNPAWRAIQRIPFDSTHLPIVIINTIEERGNYGVRQPIEFKIIANEGTYNKLTDRANVYDELASYEIRGQSSSDWAKKSYNIELKDLLGTTQDRSLLGMSSHNDWVLAANYTDRSLIRNMLTYTLARQTNTTAPDSRFVELIFDGDYMGVYQLLEKPRRDKNRINVEKQDPFQTENITGGYIFKFDKSNSTYTSFKSRSGVSLYAVYPDYKEMSAEQKTYISSYWDSIFTSCLDNNLLDSVRGYRNFIDVDSYLDFTIFNELCRNSDGFRYSTYMYKPANQKMHFGPLWDFDLTYGNSSAQEGNKTSGWLHSQGSNSVVLQKYFFKDSLLVNEFQNRYKALRKDLLSNDNIFRITDSLASYLGKATERNYQAWPNNGYAMISWVNTPTQSVTAPADLQYIKDWTSLRLKWMDENIDKLYYPLVLTTTAESVTENQTTCSAWLINGGNTISVYSPDVAISKYQLVNSSGSTIISGSFNSKSGEIGVESLNSGVFIVVFSLENGSVQQTVFAKQ